MQGQCHRHKTLGFSIGQPMIRGIRQNLPHATGSGCPTRRSRVDVPRLRSRSTLHAPVTGRRCRSALPPEHEFVQFVHGRHQGVGLGGNGRRDLRVFVSNHNIALRAVV